MQKARRWAAAVLLSAAAAHAHEHWVMVEPARNNGERVRISIRSGHDFPRGDFLLAQRLLSEMEIVSPGGERAPYEPREQNRSWSADAAFDKPGVWAACFALKKPQEDEPLYRGRCLTVVGRQDDPSRYAGGSGLEIVPAAPLSSLRPGGTLPASIVRNGAPVAGTITVTPEKGSALFLSTAPDRPASIPIRSAGAYLLTASHKGKTFALTFSVADTAGKNEP